MAIRWIDKSRLRRLEPLGLTRRELTTLDDALSAIQFPIHDKSGGDPVLACRGASMLQCEVVHRIISASLKAGVGAPESAWRCCRALDELCGLSLEGGWIREEDSHWADRDPAAHALYNDMPRLAMMLVDRGASADAQLHDGEPMIVWFAKNAGDLLLDFMDRGPDLNARGRVGGTFLHHLSWLDKFEGGQPLGLYRRAVSKAKALRFDLNVADHDGRAPLHWAAQMGDMCLAQALVEAGANPLAIGANGSAPWEEANGEQVADYLEAAALSARESMELRGMERERTLLAGVAALELMRLGLVLVDGRAANDLSELLAAVERSKEARPEGEEGEAGEAGVAVGKGAKRL